MIRLPLKPLWRRPRRRLLEFGGRMDGQIAAIRETFFQLMEDCSSVSDLERLKSTFFGPDGKFTCLTKSLRELPQEERPAAGKAINMAKKEVENLLESCRLKIEDRERLESLGVPLDPTLTESEEALGQKHPLAIVRDRVIEIFRLMGFTLAEGPELETEWFCFSALNIPETHPARDTMDTFFLPVDRSCINVSRHSNERYILRSHTTTVQIRSLLKEGPPLKVIAPGRVFRRDTIDATHSANFHQCDVVQVDRHVSLADLKASIDFFLREFFGSRAEVRYRPSFFPFTEPSFEVDVRVPNLGKLSDQWIEIFGCGMIDPAVFRAVGIDENEWSGQAWGIGLERIAMLAYGIDDVRHFYRNDLRFLKQFN